MPLLASIPGTKLYHFFEKQYNELGPVWSISLPFIGRMIQIDSPEILEHCVKTNFWSFEKGPILQGALYDLTGNGKLQCRGSLHPWLLIPPSFHRKSLLLRSGDSLQIIFFGDHRYLRVRR
ncbi:unnamed protein product [Mortierella alpina]